MSYTKFKEYATGKLDEALAVKRTELENEFLGAEPEQTVEEEAPEGEDE